VPHDACEWTELLPGAREALEALRAAGISVAVVTSGDRRRVAAELDHLEVRGLFDGVTCADDTIRRKPDPDPEPLRLGLSRLGVSAAGGEVPRRG
jgi:beta-phosphoglucomutase-like phosphatase (HAD superfamily)